MSMIMHVSLLRGDYLRAGQAFGLLLRAAPTSSPLALRSSGNWGIGAEILLRMGVANSRQRGKPRSSSADSDDEHTDDDQRNNDPHDHESDLAGALSATKEYYEALILQYPFQKHVPQAVDARTFYPALFGLLIHEAVETSRLAREISSDSPEAVIRAELRAARAIAARVDDLLVSPPYDRFAPLLRLRGMIGLWTADLVDALRDETSPRDYEDDDSMDDHSTGDYDDAARAEMMRVAAAERDRARVCFERCVRAGGEVPETRSG